MYNRLLAFCARHIATLGPIGYLPYPGTWGTLCAIPLVYVTRIYNLIPYFSDDKCIIVLLMLFALGVVHYALPQFYSFDPSEIVIDEVVGYFISMYRVSHSWQLFLLAFVIFRIYDIVKPFNIQMVEEIGRASCRERV